MKNIVYTIGDKFENALALEEFVKKNTNFKDFGIGESYDLEMSEILLEDEFEAMQSFDYICKLGYNDMYMVHTGTNGDDDSVFISLVTTVYDEDIDLRYKPLFIMVIPDDGEPRVEYTCNEK